MLTIEYIVDQLKKEYPSYNFLIYRGLVEKYIIVEIHGRADFSIWFDKKTGYKEILDELYFNKRNWFKRRFKISSLHFSKYRALDYFSRNYIRKINEIVKLQLAERKLIKDRLTESLDKIHIF